MPFLKENWRRGTDVPCIAPSFEFREHEELGWNRIGLVPRRPAWLPSLDIGSGVAWWKLVDHDIENSLMEHTFLDFHLEATT